MIRTHIILASDGRYSMIGRETIPDRSEIVAAGAAAANQGLLCWHAIMHGEFHGRGKLTIEMVEPLTMNADPISFNLACNVVMARRAALYPPRASGGMFA